MAQTYEELKKALNADLLNLKKTCEQVPGIEMEVYSYLLKNYQTLQAVIAEYILLRQAEDARTQKKLASTEEATAEPPAEELPAKEAPKLPGTQGKKKDDKNK